MQIYNLNTIGFIQRNRVLSSYGNARVAARGEYTHGFGVVCLVVERFDEVGDDGGDEEDGDQEGSDKLPHDLPVHMGLRPDHELDVVAEPGS